MYHFNTVTRTTWFPHDVKAEGLDHCYDCSVEIWVLGQYLKKYRKIEDEKELAQEVGKMSEEISKKIARFKRSLAD